MSTSQQSGATQKEQRSRNNRMTPHKRKKEAQTEIGCQSKRNKPAQKVIGCWETRNKEAQTTNWCWNKKNKPAQTTCGWHMEGTKKHERQSNDKTKGRIKHERQVDAGEKGTKEARTIIDVEHKELRSTSNRPRRYCKEKESSMQAQATHHKNGTDQQQLNKRLDTSIISQIRSDSSSW